MVPALVALAVSAAPARADAAVERRRQEIAEQILRLGVEVRREVLAGNVAAIASRIPAEGLRCAGRVVPRAHVQRDLSTPGAWLHDALFGGRGAPAAAPGRPPRSLASMLRGRDVAMAVSFAPDPRAGEVGRPCLEFRAKDVPPPGVPLCFEKRGGSWWLAESLYPCG